MFSRICLLLLAGLLVETFADSRVMSAPYPGSPVAQSEMDRRLPQSSALEREIDQVKQSLASTKSRLTRAQKAAADGRRKAEEFKKLVSRLRSIESQIGRLQKQLGSFAKIPALKMLKPVVAGLKSVKSQVARIRGKATKIQKASIDPAINKMRAFEKELTSSAERIRRLESQTGQARQHIGQLKSQVASLNYARPAVSTVESAARAARGSIQPLRQSLSDFELACSDAESEFKNFTSPVAAAVKLKSGLDKLQRDLAPIDKKAKDINKVLSKKLTFRNPFNKKKSKSYTVRQIIETPDKILKIATKPLTKLADKLLKPLTKKFRVNLKAPKEIQQLEQEMNKIQSDALNLAKAMNQLQSFASSQSVNRYESQLTNLIKIKASQLRP